MNVLYFLFFLFIFVHYTTHAMLDEYKKSLTKEQQLWLTKIQNLAENPHRLSLDKTKVFFNTTAKQFPLATFPQHRSQLCITLNKALTDKCIDIISTEDPCSEELSYIKALNLLTEQLSSPDKTSPQWQYAYGRIIQCTPCHLETLQEDSVFEVNTYEWLKFLHLYSVRFTPLSIQKQKMAYHYLESLIHNPIIDYFWEELELYHKQAENHKTLEAIGQSCSKVDPSSDFQIEIERKNRTIFDYIVILRTKKNIFESFIAPSDNQFAQVPIDELRRELKNCDDTLNHCSDNPTTRQLLIFYDQARERLEFLERKKQNIN